MENIHINTDILKNKIQKLEELSARCASVNVCVQAVQGSGISIDAVHDVDVAYAIIKDRLYTLLSNSCLFFSNIRNSVMEADCLAAAEIRGGGV